MVISNIKYEKHLGIHIDKKVTFESHVRSACKKTSQKPNAFARIAFSSKCDKRKLLLNSFSFLMLQLFGCFTIEN